MANQSQANHRPAEDENPLETAFRAGDRERARTALTLLAKGNHVIWKQDETDDALALATVVGVGAEREAVVMAEAGKVPGSQIWLADIAIAGLGHWHKQDGALDPSNVSEAEAKRRWNAQQKSIKAFVRLGGDPEQLKRRARDILLSRQIDPDKPLQSWNQEDTRLRGACVALESFSRRQAVHTSKAVAVETSQDADVQAPGLAETPAVGTKRVAKAKARAR